MALWDKIASRGNVQDRRGVGPLAFGGAGIAGLALYAAVTLLSGGSLLDVAGGVANMALQEGVSFSPSSSEEYEGADAYEVFASTVLGSANDVWQREFSRIGRTYKEPTLVLFRGSTQSACGGASSQTGPHYCPLDETIYLDETFFEELTARYGARGGDVAQAYVIAHEVGHHAQYLLGALDAGNSNEESVAIELQADCYAGVWAHSLRDRDVFAPREIEEAIDAAAAVGDDRIQERTTGRVNPETWTHGSSADRMAWFTRGYDGGTLASCATR